MDIVFIPVFNRAAMLHLVLEQIQKAKGANQLIYMFHVDVGATVEVKQVIKNFPFKKQIIRNERHSYSDSRLVVNIMQGYKAAYETGIKFGAKLIHMIEDDIMVGSDYFAFHNEVHKQQPNIFCSIGTRNHNREVLGNQAGEYYTSNFDYQSWGVCWKMEVIKEWILPHCNHHFYSNNRRYIISKFPRSRYKAQWTEQAGLIRRIQEHNKMPIAFPYVGRAFHGGFYGKNRLGKHNRKMSFTQMVDFLRKVVFNAKEMAKYVEKPEYLKDSMPCNLDIPSYKKLNFVKQVN